ncbi:MAG: HEAT repeat domain-containing protein [Leptospiraceae bacterium]|nr:HEAT repeat domain-containing protein [Leptospiraceae bacterium]
MKKFLTITLISLIFSAGSISAEKSADEHLKALSSGTDEEKIAACKYLGNEKKDKTALKQIIALLKATDNPKVAAAAAIALGYIKEKGEPTKALKEKIMSETDSNVVYACLLALYNITVANEVLEDDTKAALEYADTHHRQNEFVADALDKIKKKAKKS